MTVTWLGSQTGSALPAGGGKPIQHPYFQGG
jgi:hypothetical protein